MIGERIGADDTYLESCLHLRLFLRHGSFYQRWAKLVGHCCGFWKLTPDVTKLGAE